VPLIPFVSGLLRNTITQAFGNGSSAANERSTSPTTPDQVQPTLQEQQCRVAINRRRFLKSASALAGISTIKGVLASIERDVVSIGHGWNTLPLGAGGLVTGLHIANDGSMVCRTDVGNIYRWSGKSTDYADSTKKWLPLLNCSSLGNSAVATDNIGGWEHVLAPGNSAVHLAIFCDMTGIQSKSWLWYSTNSGGSWNKSNVAFLKGSAHSNGNLRRPYYKIAIDPANENVAYCGMPYNSGNSAAVYTSLNHAGGSTLARWTSVKTSGVTPIPAVALFTYNGSTTTDVLCAGLAIDSSLGTTTIGGQTVTKHVILPVGGVGIYESTNGGTSFVEIAVSAFGTDNFQVFNGGFDGVGNYYCLVQSSLNGACGIWRYASGKWTNITGGLYSAATYTLGGIFLIIDPRPSHQGYLSVTGPNGMGAGYTTTNANTGSPPNWRGRTGGEYPFLSAASYDIPYLNYIFGQQSINAFVDASSACVDPNGILFFGGNQSLWYGGTSQSDSAPAASLVDYGASANTYWWSMGRGQEATVSQDVLCPPGGTYPILAPQDLGAPMRGTFTTYPQNLAFHFKEYVCSNLEYAASDPRFIVATTTGQQGTGNTCNYVYSTNYGADDSWKVLNGYPTFLWHSGGAGVYGGQIVAVDHDHWMGAPAGFNTKYTPAYTKNATSSATWSLCSGLPSAQWMMRSWVNGCTSKPFAVGYGTDLGTVWACLFNVSEATATLFRSTDAGAVFGPPIANWSISGSTIGVYCLSVPGYSNELWITGSYTGGSNTNLWHVTNANTSSAMPRAISLPPLSALPIAFTLGAPSSSGGYPTLYLLGWAGYGQTQYLYKGTWNGRSVSWSLFGPTGTSADLPVSCQLCGIQALRGDWNVYQRLYVSSQQSGFAYYNP